MIYGAGALGSYVGGMLSRQHEVTLVGRREHMDAIRQAGLHITGETEVVAHPTVATSLDRDADLVVLTVKAYDTAAAARDIAATCSAPVLSLQNGLDNEQTLADALGQRRVIGGVTSHGVRYLEPGHVEHTGTGETAIGELDGALSRRVEAIAGMLTECGIATTVSSDIRREIWRKAVVNAAVNPLTAMLGCKNGRLLEDEQLRQLMHRICEEGAAVARACSVDVGSITATAEEVARRTADNHSSMLQSLQRGQPTEIDHINGAIAAHGEKHGVATPVNETLTRLVAAMEKKPLLPREGTGRNIAAAGDR